jgi:hypothetical protein
MPLENPTSQPAPRDRTTFLGEIILRPGGDEPEEVAFVPTDDEDFTSDKGLD